MKWLTINGLGLLILAQIFGLGALGFLIWSGREELSLGREFVSIATLIFLLIFYSRITKASQLSMIICIVVCAWYLGTFLLRVVDEGMPDKAVPFLSPAGAAAAIVGLIGMIVSPRR